MNYQDILSNVAVLGAAGKMGSGISWLLSVEMTNEMLKPENSEKQFVLNAIDVSEQGLQGLLEYVRTQTEKYAERRIEQIKPLYNTTQADVQDSDIIQAYVNDVLSVINTNTDMSAAKDSKLVFEAVSENQSLKVKLFKQIEDFNKNNPWYFTNTSSVPIHSLNEAAGLNGRILGFHFYNPPAVQKLVELITIPENSEQMIDFAKLFAKNIRKVVVPSNDVAGFVGNGFFMRDALFGISKAKELSKTMPLHEAIYCVDKITREYLVRPMGIFQLMDYVGIDVMQFILRVMQQYIPNENLHDELIDEYVLAGVKGGQNSDGSQKDGFFQYQKGRLVAVWCNKSAKYVNFEEFSEKADNLLGEKPAEVKPWKEVIKSENADQLLSEGFNAIKKSSDLACKIAVEYGKNAVKIATQLVNSGVAHKPEDVNTVMRTGFFHAYGPINEFFK